MRRGPASHSWAEATPVRTNARHTRSALQGAAVSSVSFPILPPTTALPTCTCTRLFYDPCSLAVLEAWASGLPVITTCFNGAAELMTSGQHGLLLRDPRDIGALAAAMRQLLDPAVRAAMADPARALAVANSLAVNFQGIMAAYSTIERGPKQ